MWFTENPWIPMLISGVCGLSWLLVWNSQRHNLQFYLALAFFGLTGLIYVVERAIVTEGERLQQDVVLMCDQFRHRDAATFDHFSDSVSDWKSICKLAMETVEIHDDLHLTDFQTSITDGETNAKVHFRANATITAFGTTAHHPFRCVLTYQKENGIWKIIDVQRLDPIRGDAMAVMEHR